MKAIYTPIKTNQKLSCDFCPNVGEGKSDYEIKIRDKETNSFMFSTFICEGCKVDKYDNNQISSCEECGALLRRTDIQFKSCFFCNTIKKKYGDEWFAEEETDNVFSKLENQLHELSLEHKQLETSHVEAIEGTLEASKNWYERKHKEEIIPLKDKSKRLSNENKKLKSQVEELENQLLGVEETSKKARRLSNENRELKEKVLGLETEIEKYKGETLNLKPGISQLKSDILELEAKLERMLANTELQTQQEQPPK